MNPRNLIERGMIDWRVVTTLCGVLVALGIVAFLTMPRQEFPEFTVRQGLVVAVVPGASPKEIEERVTPVIEDYLFSFKEVNKKKTYSVSKEGQVVVFVELNNAVAGSEAPAFWTKLRHGLNELKSQKLPPQVLALIGNNDFGDTSAVLFTVVADGRSPRDMEQYLDVLEARLRQLPATSKIRRYGTQQEVIKVTLSYDQLSRYGVRAATVWATLQGLGGLPSSARLDRDELEMPVHVDEVLRSERELGETIVFSEPTGNHVRLKDIATIHREYGHDDSYIRYNGKTAMVLSIEMQTGNDITNFGKQVDGAVASALTELPPCVEINRVADQPRVVSNSVGHFLRDFGIAIASVIVVTLLLLPLRVASVAAITVPICVGITLGILNALGVQLQTVSLAALVVVLGMIVDNAIVIIDDHVEKLDQGENHWDAAWKSAHELFVPVLVATLAIVMAYLPMPLFMSGMAGEFIESLPLTVGIALGSSLAVAVFLVPILTSWLIRRGLRSGKKKRRSMLDRLQGVFDTSLDAAFRHPYLTLFIALASIAGAIGLATTLPQQMFPKVERNQFAVEVYLPNGRSLSQTDQLIKRIEKDLLVDDRVLNVTAFVGESSPRFHTVYAPNMPARHFAQLIVNTIDNDATVAVLRDYSHRYAGEIPEGWVRWKQLDMQFTRAPIEVRLAGPDIARLKEVAEKIESHAKTIPGATWVRNDYEEPLQGIRVIPDPDACTRLGLSPAWLKTSVAIGLEGLPVATVWEKDYPVRVILHDEDTNRKSLAGLMRQQVSSPLLGVPVPLEQVARLQPDWNDGAIVRRNGTKTLTVRVDVGIDAIASPIQADVEHFIESMGALPGVSIDYGGEKESAGETYGEMLAALGASVVGIYLILLFLFRKHSLVILVMLTMPLSLAGAFLGLKITGYPFGVTSFVGIIGLMGIVVRNGIILIGHAEDLRKEGMSVFDAALAAGRRRMRPIYLTSMAAAIGVVPMILSGSSLWGPLGAVTCFGLLVSMVLTLFVLPVAYWLVCRHQRGRPLAVPASVAAPAAFVLVLLLSNGAEASPGYTLDQCIRMARANNSSISQARLGVEAAEDTKKAARVKYFPQVTASAAGLVAHESLVHIGTPGGNLPVYDGNPVNLPAASEFAYMPSGGMGTGNRMTILALTAIQPIYAGGRISTGNELASLGVEAARLAVELSERDAVAQTEEKYWRLVALREKLRTLAAFEALLASLATQVDDGVRAGLLTNNDRLKVGLQRTQTSIDRGRVESGIRLMSQDLRRHVGLPDGDSIELADSLRPPTNPGGLRKHGQDAGESRVELRLLTQAARAEKLQADMARGEMYPSVMVGASAYRLGIEGIPTMTNAVAFGMINVPLTGIWEGAHTSSSHEKSAEAANQRLAEVRALIRLEINKCWDELWTAWQMTALSELAVEQAATNLEEVSDRHRNGLVVFSDVLEAQVLRQQALDKQIDARSEYWLKRSAFLRAAGRNRS